MGNFSFRPAVRENVGLWISLASESGGGKTYSAMMLAEGIAKAMGEDGFAFIDTENDRGLHYADMFNFKHVSLKPPFTPKAYAQAVMAEDKAGAPVIVVDSMSHEWAGDGGVLDMQADEFERLGRKEGSKMVSWIMPKMEHKKMVSRLLQVKAHLILCLRAEPKIEMAKENGKMVVKPKEGPTGRGGLMPICEKSLPFEATVSFMLDVARPGYPQPIKLQEQHKPIFPLDKPLDRACGQRIAEWASGGKAKPAPTQQPQGENLLSDDVGNWKGKFTKIEKTDGRFVFKAGKVAFYTVDASMVEYVKESGGKTATFNVEFEKDDHGNKITLVTAL